MQIQFFTIRIHDQAGADELNQFLTAHRVSSIDRQFIPDGDNSAWSICVTYETGDPPRSATKQKDRERVDYREVLDEDQFRIYSKLRTLRKELSEKEGVPAYTLFNNEHLAEMVRHRVTSKDRLEQINGVGPARIEKYAQPFLELVRTETGSTEHAAVTDTAAPGSVAAGEQVTES
jgi:superfamily II DNA helicase RecQ